MPKAPDLLTRFSPNQSDTFSTNSISTAAALLAVGIPLLRVEGDRPYAATFILRNRSGEAELAQADHVAGKLTVTTLNYQNANYHVREALAKFKTRFFTGVNG